MARRDIYKEISKTIIDMANKKEKLKTLKDIEVTSTRMGDDMSITDNYDETTEFESWDISILEFAIYNNFLSKCRKESIEGIKVESFGSINGVNTISYGRHFIAEDPWWWIVKYENEDYPSNMMLHTVIYQNNSGRICTELRVSFEKDISYKKCQKFFDKFHSIAFNNSEYKGKVLSVNVHEGSFEGIDILETDGFERELILNETQDRFLDHFQKTVMRGGQARYLLNGEPGTGKCVIGNTDITVRNKTTGVVKTMTIEEFHNILD